MAITKDPLNIIICGVGGQGNILASELVGSAAVAAGFLTTIGETYGASQRGGSVMSHVRLSREIQYGPLIPKGEADVIVGFEPLEVLRVFREYGNSDTHVITNSRPNYPLGTLIGETKYPNLSDMLNEIGRVAARVQVVEATELAKQAGSAVSTNILMVGCLAGSGLIPIDISYFKEVLDRRFEGSARELNQKVFALGLEACAGT
ncbi:MAG: indolepyruvate oxidoreductase subunit beta [Syntrophomonadaceae bacterium]|nr:indolepyruvate oxidoreductase subunit beta [Syntrophomonadaceae bacterium]